MKNLIVIREAEQSDHTFIFELSPNLAEVAKLEWHTDDVVRKMQDDYISEMLAEASQPHATFMLKSIMLNWGLFMYAHIKMKFPVKFAVLYRYLLSHQNHKV
ncbi:hypothetical protein [Pseudoalteromonas sp. S3431]|uniref:hypothetical protein n=1 Tax=Pseudoalteromonas sp. S3431 TaxID=579537 RepID=UPI00049F0E69|nr:hypothetical protein [Pseudoalteromonas sp. S3431]KDC55146.1 hypothetical protein DO88_04960 [Pseudoalteromonas sp. S3431]